MVLVVVLVAVEAQESLPNLMVWWLADELVRAARQGSSDQPFEEWLQAQEMTNWLTTRKQRDTLASFAQKTGELLLEGTGKFIESFAEGLGSGLSGG